MPYTAPTRERFWNKVKKTEACWNWTGGLTGNGYGMIMLGADESPQGRSQMGAHQYSYLIHFGSLSKGLVIDHWCDNKRCVNPDHLHQTTSKKNVMRGSSNSAINARKSKCLRGHDFNKANTYISPHGSRSCRACTNWRHREFYNKGLRLT